jgi:hypothetical protein
VTTDDIISQSVFVQTSEGTTRAVFVKTDPEITYEGSGYIDNNQNTFNYDSNNSLKSS